MAYFLVVLGAMLFISGLRNTQGALFTLLTGDFGGGSGFTVTLVAIFIVGAIGFAPSLRPISGGLLVLILVSVFLADNGIFSQFASELQAGSAAAIASAPNENAPLPPVRVTLGGTVGASVAGNLGIGQSLSAPPTDVIIE